MSLDAASGLSEGRPPAHLSGLWGGQMSHARSLDLLPYKSKAREAMLHKEHLCSIED